MRIRVFETKEQAGVYVASLIERVVLAVEEPVLGLATGSTVIPAYEQLVQFCKQGLDVSRVRTINLDEYIGLSVDHEQSYHHFMDHHLFSHIPIPRENIEIPNGQAQNLTEECLRYDEVIRKRAIDLQLLGIGVNGHIGFNEPDDLLVLKTHVVDLTEETIRSNSRFFDDISNVPRQAITMGVQAILQAKQIILMAFGQAKADIIAKAIQEGIRTDVPASIIQLHQNVTVVLDAESARGLTP